MSIFQVSWMFLSDNLPFGLSLRPWRDSPLLALSFIGHFGLSKSYMPSGASWALGDRTNFEWLSSLEAIFAVAIRSSHGTLAGGGVEGAGPYTNCTVGGASWKAIAS